MTANGKQDQLRLGFLTAIQIPERGFVAGLLVTNRFGRPLEFQCTSPVKPNRTQELLYGPTLVPFILGELISRTLIEKIAVKPHVILTDNRDILEVRNHVSVPVICLSDASPSAASQAMRTPAESSESETDAMTAVLPERSKIFSLGRQHFCVHPAHTSDGETVQKATAEISAETDMKEPIDRVREALNETLGAGVAH